MDSERVIAFQIVSRAFQEGGSIPKLHTYEGADLSPVLEWSGEPTATRSFALIMDDSDAPVGVWTHRLLYDIPASAHSLPEDLKPGAAGISGTNDFRRLGYGGPCPPKGHGAHRYYFKVFALDVVSFGLAAGAKRRDLDRSLKWRILSEARCMGRYERR